MKKSVFSLICIICSWVNISAQEHNCVDAESVLRSIDWGWSRMDDSHVEVGRASVEVFGSVQTISMVRFPMRRHAVSVVASAGPSAMITSEFGVKNKALAALNGGYFDGKLYPTTYVKDEGCVTGSSIADGVIRSNAMFRIKDKRGRKVDIVNVPDSLSTVAAARRWREALVSGPVLIEDGEIVDYLNDPQRARRKFYVDRHPRTILGYSSDGLIYFIVVDGRFPSKAEGMSIYELQALCSALDLYEAVNLDGGGSSTLWTRDHGVVNHPSDNRRFDHKGERRVPNVLIVE